MKTTLLIPPAWLCLAVCFALRLQAATDPGFTSLFDGHSLAGWDGNLKLWSARDGTITGQTTADNPTKGNTFLIWKGGEVDDFELRLDYKIVGNNPQKWANSGIQYRSKDQGQWVVGGYQADFEAGSTYSGINYEERGRGIIAQRGQVTILKANPTDPSKVQIEVVGSVGKSEDIQAVIKDEDWNAYTVIARGNQMTHIINGRVTSIVMDEHAEKAAARGILALQLHAGQPMTVQFKNIQLRKLGGKAMMAKAAAELLQGSWRATRIELNGAEASQEQLDAVLMTIKGNKFESKWQDGEDSGVVQIDDSATPWKMDVESQSAGKIPAIFELDGDTLKVCYAFNGAPRPTDFKAPADSQRLAAVYQRKK